jgi:hypothetical protein
MAHDEANEPNWYGSKDDGTRYDDALYNVNRSNESNWYDGSNDGNGSNESNWYDGNATGNTEQIKINFFFV